MAHVVFTRRHVLSCELGVAMRFTDRREVRLVREVSLGKLRTCPFDLVACRSFRQQGQCSRPFVLYVFSVCSEDVFLHFVNSKCLPILLYCLQVCPLTKSDLRSLDFTVTHHLMKLFRTSNRDITNECCSHFYFKFLSEILPVRLERFLCKLQQ